MSVTSVEGAFKQYEKDTARVPAEEHADVM